MAYIKLVKAELQWHGHINLLCCVFLSEPLKQSVHLSKGLLLLAATGPAAPAEVPGAGMSHTLQIRTDRYEKGSLCSTHAAKSAHIALP